MEEHAVRMDWIRTLVIVHLVLLVEIAKLVREEKDVTSLSRIRAYRFFLRRSLRAQSVSK